VTSTAYVTRTMGPLPPRSGRAALVARFFRLGGVALVLPNLLIVRCWSALEGGARDWSSLRFQQPDGWTWVLAGTALLCSLWGAAAAVRWMRCISASRTFGGAAGGARVLALASSGLTGAVLCAAERWAGG